MRPPARRVCGAMFEDDSLADIDRNFQGALKYWHTVADSAWMRSFRLARVGCPA